MARVHQIAARQELDDANEAESFAAMLQRQETRAKAAELRHERMMQDIAEKAKEHTKHVDMRRLKIISKQRELQLAAIEELQAKDEKPIIRLVAKPPLSSRREKTVVSHTPVDIPFSTKSQHAPRSFSPRGLEERQQSIQQIRADIAAKAERTASRRQELLDTHKEELGEQLAQKLDHEAEVLKRKQRRLEVLSERRALLRRRREEHAAELRAVNVPVKPIRATPQHNNAATAASQSKPKRIGERKCDKLAETHVQETVRIERAKFCLL